MNIYTYMFIYIAEQNYAHTHTHIYIYIYIPVKILEDVWVSFKQGKMPWWSSLRKQRDRLDSQALVGTKFETRYVSIGSSYEKVLTKSNIGIWETIWYLGNLIISVLLKFPFTC